MYLRYFLSDLAPEIYPISTVLNHVRGVEKLVGYSSAGVNKGSVG